METQSKNAELANTALRIKRYRGRYSIFAGAARLSRGFRTEAEAEVELAKNQGHYRYWSQSASVTLQNTKPVRVKVG